MLGAAAPSAAADVGERVDARPPVVSLVMSMKVSSSLPYQSEERR
jgi:hypothetical protein